MRIGGTARWYGDAVTRQDVEQAAAFASEKKIPLIVLGGGSNTIFSDLEVEALVVRIKADGAMHDGDRITVQSGKILASLINELGEKGLALSALTGIPGTIGGALFGNAGQGPKGVWLDSFVIDVTAFVDGKWKTLTHDECQFRYRESVFKDMSYGLWALSKRKHSSHSSQLMSQSSKSTPPLIWQATLEIPPGDPATIKDNVEALLKKRFETQPHLKTAGSWFTAIGGTPAWQLIDRAGLRGLRIGGIQIAEKHANFLLNVERGTYCDAKQIVERVKAEVPEDLELEMSFVESDGSVAF